MSEDSKAGIPKWLATLGVGVAMGSAGVMMRQWLQQQEDDLQSVATAALPNAVPDVDGSTGPVIALITGASPGTMGGSIAEALASLGCDIAAVEHPLRRAECDELCQQLKAKFSVRAVGLTADATDATQVEASFVAAAAQLDGEPNIVVSTVGGGGVAQDGSTRNGGTDLEGRPRTELAHEESWDTTQVASVSRELFIILCAAKSLRGLVWLQHADSCCDTVFYASLL